jgi:modulator of FtsH protease HflC
MSSRTVGIIVVVGVLVLAAAMSLFTVRQSQLALRTQFGAIVGSDYKPGLHAKFPWDQVVKFDGRILSQSYTGETFLTNDNRGLIVDF